MPTQAQPIVALFGDYVARCIYAKAPPAWAHAPLCTK